MKWAEFRELILTHPHLVNVVPTVRVSYSNCPPSLGCDVCPFSIIEDNHMRCLLNPSYNALTRFIPTRLRQSNPELFI